MSYTEIYKLHYSRLVRNSILKSLILGALCGFAVAAVIAFVTVFTDFNGLWLAMGCLVAVTAAVTVALYFAFFRPDEKTAIEKLDRLGFDERFITMRELDGDDSVIARMQRAEAVDSLTDAFSRNGNKIFKPKTDGFADSIRTLGLSLGWFIAAIAVAVVGIVAMAITGIPSARKGIVDVVSPKPSYSVSYSSGSNGFFHDGNGYKYPGEGKTVSSFIQSVKQGDSSMCVVAEAFNMYDILERYIEEHGVDALEDFEFESEYYFKGWSDGWLDADGSVNPSRHDSNVTGSVNASALYGAIDIPGIYAKIYAQIVRSQGDGDGRPGDRGDAPPNPNDQNSSSAPQPPSDEGADGSAGGSITSNNGEVIDGVSDYREYYQEYYDLAMKMLAEGKELPPELRKIVETYISALK